MKRLNFTLILLLLGACSSKNDSSSDDGELEGETVGDSDSDESVDGDDGDDGDGDSDGADADADADVDGGADGDGDDGGAEPCTATVEEFKPDDGDEGWFYLENVEVDFDLMPEASHAFTLVDSAGADVAFEVEWSEDYETAIIDGEFTGNETYTLTATCANELTTTFTTSEYGAALDAEESSLIGNVYTLDLPSATFTEPPFVGAFLGEYLTSVLLAGIADVGDGTLTLLVAQGVLNEDGEAVQDMGLGTYDFPPADFSAAPFFSVDTDRLDIIYTSGSTVVPIPLIDMHLEGTISPDAVSMGGAWIAGMLDTSNLGSLIELTPGTPLGPAPDAVCNYLELLTIACEPCEGSDYCLYVEAHFEEAPIVDIVLDPDPLGEDETEDETEEGTTDTDG
jgi:hypothetical protein